MRNVRSVRLQHARIAVLCDTLGMRERVCMCVCVCVFVSFVSVVRAHRSTNEKTSAYRREHAQRIPGCRDPFDTGASNLILLKGQRFRTCAGVCVCVCFCWYWYRLPHDRGCRHSSRRTDGCMRTVFPEPSLSLSIAARKKKSLENKNATTIVDLKYFVVEVSSILRRSQVCCGDLKYFAEISLTIFCRDVGWSLVAFGTSSGWSPLFRLHGVRPD